MKRHVGSLVSVALLVLTLLCAAGTVSANIIGYSYGDVIKPQANAYRSRRMISPVNYYRLPVCRPNASVMKENKEGLLIGEILTGNRLVPTDFDFIVGQNVKCATLCTAHFPKKAVQRAVYLIKNDYETRMFIDNVPLVMQIRDSAEPAYRLGYPIGAATPVKDKKQAASIIFNHLSFNIRIKQSQSVVISTYEIVGFSVTPSSVSTVTTCNETTFEPSSQPMQLLNQEANEGTNIVYTYSVTWEENAEPYLLEQSVAEKMQKRGHKIAAVYGALLVVLAGIVVGFVMLRTVRKDLAMYLDEELDEAEMREESGWKLVRGDVFRPPPHAALLATLVGAGAQIAVTIVMTVLLCAFHVVDATHRGSFLTTAIGLFLFAHVVSGLVTSRLLKLFNYTSWKMSFGCTMAFPVALGCGIMTLNLIQWAKHSTAAIPFVNVLVLSLTWVLISLPFGGAGIYWGLTMDTVEVTAKVSSIPRLIPEQAGHMTFYYVFCGSLTPFIACCVEVSFILKAFWREEQLYLYGLISFFLVILIALCAEVGIVVTYFTLRCEDYRWWWRSYMSLSASGVYVFLYSIYFLKQSLRIRAFSSIVLFLGYMMGASLMFGMVLGSIGFVASLWLVQKMYSSIKAD